MEKFKVIIGYEDYEISNYGRIWSNKSNKFLKDRINGMGYKITSLSTGNSKYKQFNIHRLVALYFVEGYKEGMIVNHIDSDRSNCYYKNLEWTTYSENLKHAMKTNGQDFIHKYKVVIATNDNEVLEFKGSNQCGKYFEKSRQTIDYYIKNSKELNGWSFKKLDNK